MTCDFYRYSFSKETSLAEVENSLFLAVFSAEGLHGRAQVRLDAAYFMDEKRRACVVDAASAVGKTIAQVFTGLLAREFGDDAFTVERVVGAHQAAVDTICGGSP